MVMISTEIHHEVDFAEMIRSLSEEELRLLLQKLRRYAWQRFRRLHDATGCDLDDMVHRSLLDVLEGKRHARSDDVQSLRGLTLFSFLAGVIRSNVSHTWEKEKKNVALDDLVFNRISTDADRQLIERGRNDRESGWLREVDDKADFQRLMKQIFAVVGKDPELAQIVTVWERDPGLKPNEVAAELGIGIHKMRTAQKRLRRLLLHSAPLSND